MNTFNALFNILITFLQNTFDYEGVNDQLTETAITWFSEFASLILENDSFAKIYNFFVPIATLLMAVYVLLDILEKISMDGVSLDQIVKSLFKFVFAMGLISNGIVIFKGFNAASVIIAERFSGFSATSSMTSPMDESIIKQIADMTTGGFATAKIMLILANPVVLFHLCVASLYACVSFILCPIAALNRAVKMGIYCLTSPFVFADVAGRGLSGSKSYKFLLRLLSFFIELPVMVIALKLVDSLASGSYSSQEMSFIAQVALLCIYITALFSANKFAKNLFD